MLYTDFRLVWSEYQAVKPEFQLLDIGFSLGVAVYVPHALVAREVVTTPQA